jgi:hypothetical protein
MMRSPGSFGTRDDGLHARGVKAASRLGEDRPFWAMVATHSSQANTSLLAATENAINANRVGYTTPKDSPATSSPGYSRLLPSKRLSRPRPRRPESYRFPGQSGPEVRMCYALLRAKLAQMRFGRRCLRATFSSFVPAFYYMAL